MANDDDKRLWQRVTEGVTPLHRKALELRLSQSRKGPASKPKPAHTIHTAPIPRPKPAPAQPPSVDRATLTRFRKGQMPIEGRLDLHGMTQEQAQAALGRFLESAQIMQKRCVLVVHGKGRLSEGGGVLRRMVPIWLSLPSNQSKVLAIAPAQPKHGGSGALYVYVRRRR